MGKYLMVDLSEESISEQNSDRYVPKFIGGYGMALKLIWELTSGKTGEFDPENILVFASGPLVGTPAPGCGRIEIAGIAPQGYPIPWVCDSGMGGDFGQKLKFAGYDAIVIRGKAEKPKYLFVENEEAELKDAKELWGLDTFSAQKLIKKEHGNETTAATIGPAGEHLVRWSIISSNTENAAGQGGFGAVMGSKRLKAVAVKGGEKRITIANPSRLLEECIKINLEYNKGRVIGKVIGKKFGSNSSVKAGSTACMFCHLNFAQCFKEVPCHLGHGSISGMETCVADAIKCKFTKEGMSGRERWETQFELAQYMNQLGLNQWEANIGFPGWFERCKEDGVMDKVMGEPIKVLQKGDMWLGSKLGMSPEFWFDFFRKVAYREGVGDIFAEGVARAAERIGGIEEAKMIHKHGYASHWDGRELHFIYYPMWIVSALTWAMRGRDPMNSTHGFCQNLSLPVKEWFGGRMPYEELKIVANELYGTANAVAGFRKPELGYKDKEIPTIWHEHASMLKNCLVACDQAYFDGPLLWKEEGGKYHAGDYTALARLYSAVTGVEHSFKDMYRDTERCFNLMRAIHVRQGRKREHDESVIPYFEQPDFQPKANTPHTLDANKFRHLMDRYYERRGWDKHTGWPTREKLEELDLKDVADELEELEKLPSQY
jgi:aldehyde:ferredoxin oxidoreductase